VRACVCVCVFVRVCVVLHAFAISHSGEIKSKHILHIL
jgi:hypothetical protein